MTIITSSQNTSYTVVNNGEYLLLGGQYIADASDFGVVGNIGASNVEFTTFGDIFGNDGGIRLSSSNGSAGGSGSHEVTIGATSNVAGYASGSDGISILGTNNSILNNGNVSGETTGIALDFAGGTSEVVNTGTISSGDGLGLNFDGDTTALGTVLFTNSGNVTADGDAIRGRFATLELNNSGTILSNGDGLSHFGGSGSLALSNSGTINGLVNGVSSSVEGNKTLQNSGTIQGASNSIDFSGAGNAEIFNSGQLLGDVDTDDGEDEIINNGEIVADLFTGDGNDIVSNSGEIIGTVDTDDDNDTVTNTGSITGDLRLDDGDDMVDNRFGVVSGRIFGEDDNDTFYANSNHDQIFGGNDTDILISATSATINSDIENLTLSGSENTRGTGNSADNIILGNAGNNVLTGADGADSLDGGLGKDALFGGADDDTLFGQAGDDRMFGGNQADTLDGGDGDDYLNGGGSNDKLYGGDGDDTLYGNAGFDVMAGGLGRDVFVFKTAFDSQTLTTNADRILGFRHGEDLVDLSDILAGEFDYRGTAGFTASGQAEVAFSVIGTHGYIEYDITGNGVANGLIRLQNQTTLFEDDLIL